MKQVKLNDRGIVFKVTIRNQDNEIVPVQSATVKKFYFRKPDGTEVNVNASFYTDGTDGILAYTSTTGFLNQVGIWEYEPYIEISLGEFTGTPNKFMVKDIIND